jgi:hypothetical protein
MICICLPFNFLNNFSTVLFHQKKNITMYKKKTLNWVVGLRLGMEFQYKILNQQQDDG